MSEGRKNVKNEHQKVIGKMRENLQRAAKMLKEGDILLVQLGAGMSADSGLVVFKDFKKNQIYKQRGLDYVELSRPSWLEDAEIEGERELFYGFWGSFHNACRYVNLTLLLIKNCLFITLNYNESL